MLNKNGATVGEVIGDGSKFVFIYIYIYIYIILEYIYVNIYQEIYLYKYNTLNKEKKEELF